MIYRAKLARTFGHLYKERGAQRVLRALCGPPSHTGHRPQQTQVNSTCGTNYYLDTGSPLEWHLYTSGEYERVPHVAMLEKLPLHGVLMDGGANIGIHTCAISRQRPDATVFAIEPVERLQQRLRANISLNHLADVSLVAMAVGDQTGEVTLFLPPGDSTNQGQASLFLREYLDSQGVSVPPVSCRHL